MKDDIYYLIYVNNSELEQLSGEYIPSILESINEDCTDPDNAYLLFGVTDKKEYLDLFFGIHRRELFTVITMNGNELANIGPKQTKIIRNKFLPHWLTTQDMCIPCWIDGKLKRILTPMVLAEHEWDAIVSEREARDDDISYLIERPESFDILLHKLFTNKYQKIFDDLNSDELIDKINVIYGLNNGAMEFNLPINPELFINDWYCLKITYGEILIGGLDGDENPYF
jgi:hypothetical protein